MIVWIVLTVLITLAAVALVIPLLRPRAAAGQGGATAVGILRDQLAELDAQQASGAVTADEAARLKLEIERRMLAEAREGEAPARPLKDRTLLLLAFGVAGGVALGAAGLYAVMGKPGAPSATQPAQSLAAAGADHPGGGDIQSQILQLQQQVQANPDDADGWRLLGWSYFQTGAFNEAAVAYGRAASLQPDNADHPSAQGESLVQAAGGQVTPAAAAAFQAALRINPQDPRARYFLAVQKDQSGDADGAMTDWIDIVNTAPPGAPWVGEVRRFVEDLARERGVDISRRLKPAAAATGAAMPGPNAEQVAAAQQMAPGDRDAMIRGMVDGLEEKLRANPRDAEGWVRLMRARMVLGDRTAAATALRNARAAFAGDAAGQAQISEAARGLGVPGA